MQQHRLSRTTCSEGMQNKAEKKADQRVLAGALERHLSPLDAQEQSLSLTSQTLASMNASGPHSGAGITTELQLNANVAADNDIQENAFLHAAVSSSDADALGTPSQPFVIHTIRAIDPLVGELFVCPQTLEAVCLQRMVGLPVIFSWERLPSPFPWDRTTPRAVPWWPLSSKGTPLPAAINPKTGGVLSGRRLMEALRKACTQSQVRGTTAQGTPHSTGAPDRIINKHNIIQNDSARDASVSEHPLFIGTYEMRNSATVERATQLATTELVQQAVQAALRYYLWKDDATFIGFTKPLLQNTLGVAYGTYYCWAMRRSISDVSSRSSPRVSPDDLACPFPNPAGPGATHEAPTVEELVVLDGLRSALRVAEQLLEGRAFFGGTRADALDAVVFAHLAILFSLPLPDHRELQAILANRGALFQYCFRVQGNYKVWPAGPSLLFGVLSLSEMATGMPLSAHTWRQRHGSSLHDSSDEHEGSGTGRDIYRLLWWLGAASCCAALLVVAGKTPLRIGLNDARAGALRPSGISNEDDEVELDEDDV